MQLTHALYTQVFENRLLVRHIGGHVDVSSNAEIPFSSTRLLVGDFAAAQRHFKKTIAECIAKISRLNFGIKAVVHPREKTEGGLSLIEERILEEILAGCGARKTIVHVGPVLSDAEVSEKLGA